MLYATSSNNDYLRFFNKKKKSFVFVLNTIKNKFTCKLINFLNCNAYNLYVYRNSMKNKQTVLVYYCSGLKPSKCDKFLY